MIILVFAVLIYGIIAGIPHEYLYMGLSLMVAGMCAGYGGSKK